MKKTKHQIKSELSLQKLTESALKLFTVKGYDRVTIDEITSEAGYSKATFYLHFKNKEELFLKLMELRLGQFKDRFFKTFTPEDSLENTIRKGVEIFADLTQKDKWAPIFFEFYIHSLRNDQIKQQLTQHYSSWIETFLSVLKEYIADYQLTESQLSKVIHTAIIIMDGYHLHNTLSPGTVDIDMVTKIIIGMLKKTN